ncbi:MAG TPA: magnesium transporter [Gaiellaceae bacterium]|nr:magnesium transporter [Gaiellaceae bacterium]
MSELTVDTRDQVQELLDRRDLSALRRLLAEMPVPDIADLLHEVDKPDRVILFRLLPRPVSCEVFAELEGESGQTLIEDLTDEEARRLLAGLAPDDRTQLLEELPGLVTQRLLNLLSPKDLAEARFLLGYPEDSVGREMTPDYVAVKAHWTVRQALDHIRRRGRESETINEIYVTDAGWRLLDAVELSAFVLGDPDDSVESLMDRSFVSVFAHEDRERAVELIGRYDRYALPVVDSDGVLVGIVTVDDLLDVAEEEATEDFQLTAAVVPLDTPYREASIWRLYRKRIAWLVVLVFVALMSSAVIAAFEATLETVIALAFFIPLLIGAGGNTGAQSATLVIRALATGDLKLRQYWSAIGKELVVGLCLGATMGAASALLGFLRGGVEVGIVVGLTMVCIVLVANLVGGTLPFLLTRVGLDPAVASSPLIATIMDAVGLLIYFTIAIVVLGATGVL